MKIYFYILGLLTRSFCDKIHSSLKNYELLHKDNFVHNVVKRGASSSSNKYNHIREISFKSHGEFLRLILSPKKGLFHSKLKVVEMDSNDNENHVEIDRDEWFEGRVFNSYGSHVQLHLDKKGLLTGRIHTPQQIYHIEPAWRHLQKADQDNMIIYRESDIIYPDDDNMTGCRSVSTYGLQVDMDTDKDHLDDTFNNRTKRSSYLNSIISDDKSPRLTRCPLMLVADYKFYREMGGGSTKATVSYLISLIDRVNKMYEDTIWSDSYNNEGFSGMGFSIKKIIVHKEPTPVSGDLIHYNMFRSNWDARELLEVFSRQKSHRDYCLAHLFTDVAFEGGILGLAYVGSHREGSVGGICSPRYFKNGYTLYLNTGLSSSRNHYGQRVITREHDLVTAHEFGHNWGAEHDPDIAECSPRSSQGGSYLMYTYSVSGYDVNNKKFSPCSLKSIKKVLLHKSAQCFTETEESFCGNLKVEGDEECDAGLLGSEEKDACCDENCRLRENAICSDKNSPCCNMCHFEKVNTKCRTENLASCEKEAKCTGFSANCPRSEPMADGTNCIEKGKCQDGRCSPYCETLGMFSCMCDSEETACRRCCRSGFNNSCSLSDIADVLPDGTPCFKGLCNNGLCETTNQDVVRYWDVIDDISFSLVYKIFLDNLVMIIVLISMLVWIPASCYINHLDKKRKEAENDEWIWRRQGGLVHPSDQRQIHHVQVPRRQQRNNQSDNHNNVVERRVIVHTS